MAVRRVHSAFFSILFTVAGLCLSCTASAHAAEITILVSNALKEPLQHLVPAFTQSSGHAVRILSGGTEAITKRIRDGEIVDAVLIAAPNVDQLIREAKLAAGSRTDVAQSLVGVAVPLGQPKPNVSSVEGVKRAALAATRVAYSSGPSGFHLQKVFERMGIAEQIKVKVIQPPSGVQIAELLARGEADLGFSRSVSCCMPRVLNISVRCQWIFSRSRSGHLGGMFLPPRLRRSVRSGSF